MANTDAVFWRGRQCVRKRGTSMGSFASRAADDAEEDELLPGSGTTGVSPKRWCMPSLAQSTRWLLACALAAACFGMMGWAASALLASADGEPPPPEPITLTSTGCVPRAQLRLERTPDAHGWLGGRTQRPTVGFVIGCTGKYSRGWSYRCVAAIESLVLIGGWYGPVYLLSDSGTCFDEGRLRALTGSAQIHVVTDVFSRLGAEVSTLLVQHEAGGRGGALKALMHEVVPAEGAPEILVWHDADHVFAVPGCVARMVRDVPLHFHAGQRLLVGRWVQRCIKCKKNCGYHGGGRCGERVHIGTLASHREWSRELMRDWTRRLIAEPTIADYIPLWEAVKANHTPVAELPAEFKDIFWNARPDNDTRTMRACINHVSGGRCAANGKLENGLHKIRDFFSSLCLPVYFTSPERNAECKMPEPHHPSRPGPHASSSSSSMDAPLALPTGFATRWCDGRPDSVEPPDRRMRRLDY